jgi:hypothetical protein
VTVGVAVTTRTFWLLFCPAVPRVWIAKAAITGQHVVIGLFVRRALIAAHGDWKVATA